MSAGLSRFNAVSLALGFAFLYIPVLLLAAYSFNASRNVTVWAGFSLHWYAALWSNAELWRAAATSLAIAAVSATAATLLGLLAAVALTRLSRFPGRALFTGMVFAPVVMPEVITGLSLLLLFVALDISRGFWTVTAAHITFTLGFAAIVIQSRLVTVDRSLEEAAMDLGAPPARAFLLVTIPALAPALGAAWLLAFVLSLDDLVITRFTSGPGLNTLPMLIYSEARRGVKPEINAVSTIMICLAAFAVIAASLAAKRFAWQQQKPSAAQAGQERLNRRRSR